MTNRAVALLAGIAHALGDALIETAEILDPQPCDHRYQHGPATTIQTCRLHHGHDGPHNYGTPQ